MNISNSLRNRYSDYKNAELCGLRFEAVNIKKTHQEYTSPAMEKGKWFEFICTGALNRDGSEPQPELLKTEKLSTEANRIMFQKKNFDKIYNSKTYEPNLTMEQEINGQNYKAVFDILELDKEKNPVAIRDIKLTGVINDKWSDFGWVDIQYKKHINQAKFYIWIYWKRTDQILPFYFDVFSSKNDFEFKIFKVTMDKSALLEFEIYLFDEVKMINFDIKTGFIAYPDLMPCFSCPVKNDCNRFTNMPAVKKINL